MQNIHTRLAKLEDAAFNPMHRRRVHWAIQGPHNMPEGAVVVFLRECGHEVRDEDLNIIRIVVGAGEGRPVDLPLKYLSHECHE